MADPPSDPSSSSSALGSSSRTLSSPPPLSPSSSLSSPPSLYLDSLPPSPLLSQTFSPTSPRPPRPPSTPISTTSAYPFAPEIPSNVPFDPRHVLRRLNYVERVATHLTNTVKHINVKQETVKKVDEMSKSMDEARATQEYLDRLISSHQAGQQEKEAKERDLEERIARLEAGASARRAVRGRKGGKRRGGGVSSSSSSSSIEKAASPSPGPVMIFWDSENCNISGQENPGPIVRKLRSMFVPLGPIKIFRYFTRTIHAWDNLPTFRARIAANGVELRDCPSWLGKGTVDHTLLVELMTAALDHPPPATFVLISGDKDFSYLLNTLKNRGYNLIVIAGGTHYSGVEELRNPASAVYRWSDILREVEATQGGPVSITRTSYSAMDPAASLEHHHHRYSRRYRPPIEAPPLEKKISYFFEAHKANLLESLYALAKSEPEVFTLKKGDHYYDLQSDIEMKKSRERRQELGFDEAEMVEDGEEIDQGEVLEEGEGSSDQEDLGAAVQETLLSAVEGDEGLDMVAETGGLGLEDRLEPDDLEELARVGAERKRSLQDAVSAVEKKYGPEIAKRMKEWWTRTPTGAQQTSRMPLDGWGGEGEEQKEGPPLSLKELGGLRLPPPLARRVEEDRREEVYKRVAEGKRSFSTLSAQPFSRSTARVACSSPSSSLRVLASRPSSYPSLVGRRLTARLVSSLGSLGRARFGGR